MGKLVTTILLLLCFSTSFAKDLGVFGAVYPISEEDIQEFILNKLHALEANGELAKMQTRFVDNVKEHTLRPTPVKLSTTDNPETLYYDPTFTLARDISNGNGKILFHKGYRVNPLEKIKLHGVLFFLNADDKRQVTWATQKAKQYDYVKYILVQGNIKDAGNALNNRIYFDQYGKITTKLGIKHIPCIVTQDGLRLKIQEFKMEDK